MAALNLSLAPDAIAEAPRLSWSEFLAGMKPLLFLVAGITLYCLFIFKFYRFLAKRDILQLKDEDFYQTYEGFSEKLIRMLFYILENLVLVPIIVFFWFVVLVLFLAIMSKNMEVELVLLVSAAFVAAVRIISYYDEGLAQDLAKLVPLTLLVVFLTDLTTFSLAGYIETIKEIPLLLKHLIYYLLVVTPLEYVLRITHGIATYFIKKEAEQKF